MKKETRLRVSKKFADISIECFLTDQEIGASISLSDLEASLFSDLKEPLAKSLSDAIGNPALIMTKKAMNQALIDAANDVLKKEISEALGRIIEEMKLATSSVAALKQSED